MGWFFDANKEIFHGVLHYGRLEEMADILCWRLLDFDYGQEMNPRFSSFHRLQNEKQQTLIISWPSD